MTIHTLINTEIAHGTVVTSSGGDIYPDSTYIISTEFDMPINVWEVGDVFVLGHMFKMITIDN